MYNLKRNPVAAFGLLVVLLNSANLFLSANGMVGRDVINWMTFIETLAAAGLAWWVKNIVTPLSDPKAADGRALVPSPPARVPAGTTDAQLDATRTGEDENGKNDVSGHRSTSF